jgi:hypothetical protein
MGVGIGSRGGQGGVKNAANRPQMIIASKKPYWAGGAPGVA